MDDEADVAELLAEMLAGDGHRVETAPSGRAALDKLAAQRFDLVLSDLRVPDLDGPGLYREVARRDPQPVSKPLVLDDIRRAMQQVLGAG